MKVLIADRLADNVYNVLTDTRYKLTRLLQRSKLLNVTVNGLPKRHPTMPAVDYPEWSDYDCVIWYPMPANLFGGVLNRQQQYYLDQMSKYNGKLVTLVDDIVYPPRAFCGGMARKPGYTDDIVVQAAAKKEQDWSNALCVSSNLESIYHAVVNVHKKSIQLPSIDKWVYCPYTLESLWSNTQYKDSLESSQCVYLGLHKPDRQSRLLDLFDTRDLVTGGSQRVKGCESVSSFKSVRLPQMLQMMSKHIATIMICSPSQVCRTSRLFESMQTTVCFLDAQTCPRNWISEDFADLSGFLFISSIEETSCRLEKLRSDSEFRMHLLSRQQQLLESWKPAVELELNAAAKTIGEKLCAL